MRRNERRIIYPYTIGIWRKSEQRCEPTWRSIVGAIMCGVILALLLWACAEADGAVAVNFIPKTCIYSFILLDDMTPLTYWKSTWDGAKWSAPPVKVFDSSPTAANFTYLQSAGFTKDGTGLGVTLSHAVAGTPPDATTLDFLGDGFPTAVDLSNGNALGAPWLALSQIQNPSGSWKFNGAYYQIAVDTSGPVAIRILSTRTPLVAGSWIEVDAANHPVLNTGNPEWGSSSTYRCTVSVPDKIDFFFSTPGQTQVFVQTFDLLEGAWSAPYGLFGPRFGESYSPKDIIRFPNGDLAGVSLVQTFGGFLHWSYRILDGSSKKWGPEISLPIGAFGNRYIQAIIDPYFPDVMNIWASNFGPSHTDTFSLYTATHDGTVNGPLFTTRAVDDFAAGGMGHGSASQGIQYVPITDTNAVTDSVWIGAGNAFAETFLPIPPGDQGIGPEVAGYMVDELAQPLPAGLAPVIGGASIYIFPFPSLDPCCKCPEMVGCAKCRKDGKMFVTSKGYQGVMRG